MNNVKKLTIPETLSETAFTLCRTTYDKELDFLICLNINKGIEAFSSVMTHLKWYEETYSVDTPSKVRVKTTMFDSYPDNQCRIDTLLAGSLCPKEQFPCNNRPACWFKN